jgi:anhydro-N-acetylmuramic acid kinase
MTDQFYIGLMSGTSLDGIDAVLVRFEQEQPKVLDAICLPLSPDLQNDIKSLINPSDNEINRLTALDVQLGEAFAKAVNQLIKKSNIEKENITAIGSHGQTIRHCPTAVHPSTVQIGDPNIIAERTGITTVADFRRRDMAAGGQGAPLVPAFHEQVFRQEKKNRIILNLGGIANITILPKDKNKSVTGFDTGPANTLINHWIQQQQNKNYDNGGKWASSGQINEQFLDELLQDDYFDHAPPKSTGTEYFNAAWLTNKLSKFSKLSDEDIQASLTALTAITVSDAINKYATKIAGVDEVIVCGGGVHNNYLLQQLQQGLPLVEINSSAKYGLDPDYIEATAFAWLAKQTMEHKTGNLPEVTGARRTVVLGGVYYS